MQANIPSTIVALFPLIVVLGVVAFGVFFAKRKSYSGPGGDVIVRCREGHLFTTIWVPFVSFKAVRLGMIRFQRCPVDNRLTFVVPVHKSELTDEEKQMAATYHDSRIP